MTTLRFPTKPSPVEPDPADILARLAVTDPRHLCQAERVQSVKRNAPKVEAAKAELAALYARLEAEEAEAKKGGRPRKADKPRSKSFKRPEDYVHGTRYSYEDRKCRCDECVTFYRTKYRPRSEANAARIRHGRARYRKGCRCEVCVKADTLYRKSYRAAEKRKAAAAVRRDTRTAA